jgi:hypothetical protein
MSNYLDTIQELIERKLDPKAKVRNRPNPVFDAKSKLVKDNKDHFPLGTVAQARNALARSGAFTSAPKWFDGSLSEFKAKVKATVKREYPSIDQGKN